MKYFYAINQYMLLAMLLTEQFSSYKVDFGLGFWNAMQLSKLCLQPGCYQPDSSVLLLTFLCLIYKCKSTCMFIYVYMPVLP